MSSWLFFMENEIPLSDAFNFILHGDVCYGIIGRDEVFGIVGFVILKTPKSVEWVVSKIPNAGRIEISVSISDSVRYCRCGGDFVEVGSLGVTVTSDQGTGAAVGTSCNECRRLLFGRGLGGDAPVQIDTAGAKHNEALYQKNECKNELFNA